MAPFSSHRRSPALLALFETLGSALETGQVAGSAQPAGAPEPSLSPHKPAPAAGAPLPAARLPALIRWVASTSSPAGAGRPQLCWLPRAHPFVASRGAWRWAPAAPVLGSRLHATKASACGLGTPAGAAQPPEQAHLGERPPAAPRAAQVVQASDVVPQRPAAATLWRRTAVHGGCHSAGAPPRPCALLRGT